MIYHIILCDVMFYYIISYGICYIYVYIYNTQVASIRPMHFAGLRAEPLVFFGSSPALESLHPPTYFWGGVEGPEPQSHESKMGGGGVLPKWKLKTGV